MHRAAPLAHLGALLASCCVDTLAQQQRELLHSPQLQALSERRALQAAYVMDDAAIATAVAECAAEAPDFVCPVSQQTYGAVGTWDVSAVTGLAGSAPSVGFFGASMATRDRKHIQVDAIRKNLGASKLHIYNGISAVVTILFTLFLFVLAFHYVLDEMARGATKAGTGLPEVVVSLPIALAFGIIIVRFSVQAASHFASHRRGDPVPDAGPAVP